MVEQWSPKPPMGVQSSPPVLCCLGSLVVKHILGKNETVSSILTPGSDIRF